MSEVIDRENGIWVTEIPVRCQTSGWLVLCNEEVIGAIEMASQSDYVAMLSVKGNLGDFKTLGGYKHLEIAARAVAVERMGDWLIAGPLMDEDDPQAWENAVNAYILSGVGAG